MADFDPSSLLHLPGWAALGMTLYKSIIGQHGKRLTKVEEALPELQSKADAWAARNEMRGDLQRVEDNLGRKIDEITRILIRRNYDDT